MGAEQTEEFWDQVRIPAQLVSQIEDHIKKEKDFPNRSQLASYAIKRFLEDKKGIKK